MAAPWSGQRALCPALARVINTLTPHMDTRLTVQCTDSPFCPGLEPSEDGIVKKFYWKGIKVWDVCIIDVEGPNREKAVGSIGKGYTVKICSKFWARASRQNILEPDHCWIVTKITIVKPWSKSESKLLSQQTPKSNKRKKEGFGPWTDSKITL